MTIKRTKEDNVNGYYIIEPIEIDGVIYELMNADGDWDDLFKEGDSAWFKCISKSTYKSVPYLKFCYFQSFNKYHTYEKSLQKKEDGKDNPNIEAEDTGRH